MADQAGIEARTPGETLGRALAAGEAKVGTGPGRAFALAVLAGALIGLGGMMLLLVRADGSLPPAASALLAGAAFSLGLFGVMTCGAELFTGDSLMVLGALDGRYGWGRIAGHWALVYAGNLVGSLAVAALLRAAGFASLSGGAVGAAAVAVAQAKCSLGPAEMLARGALCNLLVCLAVWIGFAGRTVTDRFVAALMPVTAFVACGLEHSVANMMLLPFALMVDAAAAPAPGAMLANLAVVTAGNVIGGAALFAGTMWLALGGRGDG